tara:strand:+ start:3421 stop:3537 length:117 start_codon:yes stop_codon:yes gene_type:complete
MMWIVIKISSIRKKIINIKIGVIIVTNIIFKNTDSKLI